MSAADRFYQLERQLMVGRARGTLTPRHEDDILEESDDLWRLMTREEREEADRRVRNAAVAQAPDDLHLVDRLVDVGDEAAPRMAA